jgi:hypothetical protein
MKWNRLAAIMAAPLLPLCPYGAQAEVDYYLGSELGWMQIAVNDEDFHPIMINAHFNLRHSSGLGAELLLATGVSDDEAAQVELELDRHAALYATYSAIGKHVTLTFGAGYGETRLDASLRGGDYPGKSTYEGGSFFVRFTEEFKRWPNWEAALGFYSLFDNSDVDIWSVNLGAQYAF